MDHSTLVIQESSLHIVHHSRLGIDRNPLDILQYSIPDIIQGSSFNILQDPPLGILRTNKKYKKIQESCLHILNYSSLAIVQESQLDILQYLIQDKRQGLPLGILQESPRVFYRTRKCKKKKLVEELSLQIVQHSSLALEQEPPLDILNYSIQVIIQGSPLDIYCYESVLELTLLV